MRTEPWPNYKALLARIIAGQKPRDRAEQVALWARHAGEAGLEELSDWLWDIAGSLMQTSALELQELGLSFKEEQEDNEATS